MFDLVGMNLHFPLKRSDYFESKQDWPRQESKVLFYLLLLAFFLIYLLLLSFFFHFPAIFSFFHLPAFFFLPLISLIFPTISEVQPIYLALLVLFLTFLSLQILFIVH
jgi:hypothetical protein